MTDTPFTPDEPLPPDVVDTLLHVLKCAREHAEAEVLRILREVCDGTGCDLADVTVHIAVVPVDGEPRRRPMAVRIDLTI